MERKVEFNKLKLSHRAVLIAKRYKPTIYEDNGSFWVYQGAGRWERIGDKEQDINDYLEAEYEN